MPGTSSAYAKRETPCAAAGPSANPAIRHPIARRSDSARASAAVAAINAPAIRQSLSTSPVSASPNGMNPQPSMASARQRRSRPHAQPASNASPPHSSASCTTNIGPGPEWIAVSCRHSHSIAGGCQSSKSPLTAWPYCRIASHVMNPGQ